MNVQSSKQGNVAVVQVTGRMDAESAPAFETACEQYLQEGSSHIVVEMAGLTYVSSMGLRSFLVIAKKAKAKSGAVLLCGMHGFVKEVFDMTHVTSLFKLFDSTEAALRSI
jgi:anti-anti-sigma factor